MDDQQAFVIIGAGVGGVTAAKTLRDQGFKGKLTLVDSDCHLPYDRPPLSKSYLKGEVDKDSILLQKEDFYQKEVIDLLLGKKVTEVDPVDKSITFQSGEKINWDKLLITTGSKLKRLQNVKGSNLDGIHYLKTLNDANAIKESLDSLHHLVIIGAGFIGMEIASSLIELGKKVTVINAGNYPLAHIFGEEVGRYFADVHCAKGIELIANDYVTQFTGDTCVSGVQTKNGRKIDCDRVLIGIGVSPNTSIIDSQLDCNNGILVNEYCETSIPDVYAAGDCTKWPYHINNEIIRVEHWDHAINHARTAATNMLNPKSTIYSTIPYFWSYQHHLSIQYLGHPTKWDYTVLRGNFNDDKFTLFYIFENRVVGALIINEPRNVLPIRKLIKLNVPVDNRELRDQENDLRKVVRRLSVS